MWNVNDIISALSKDIIRYKNITFKKKIDNVVIDSRLKSNNSLFIALIGENHDAHNFINQAKQNGSNVIIASYIPKNLLDDSNLILVKNTLTALKNLAKYSRTRSRAKIIAITGSVGKTTTKEIFYEIFSTKFKSYRTINNYNNEIGLSLSLVNMTSDTEYGIFELGMNNKNEISNLAKILNPDIAIIINIYRVHLQNFKDLKDIATAKAEILSSFTEKNILILNKDDEYFNFLKMLAVNKYSIKEKNIFTFGKKVDSDILLEDMDIEVGKIKIDNKIENKKLIINNKNLNEEIILNFLPIITCISILNLKSENFVDGFYNVTIPSGRGDIIKAKNDSLIIDGSYNSSLSSIISGLKFLSYLKRSYSNLSTTVILSDIKELGVEEAIEHKKIVKYLLKYKVDEIILIGELVEFTKKELDNLNKLSLHFRSLQDFIREKKIFNKSLIFIKGSNKMKMKDLVEIYREKNET